jgi:hypothetical protein
MRAKHARENFCNRVQDTHVGEGNHALTSGHVARAGRKRDFRAGPLALLRGTIAP